MDDSLINVDNCWEEVNLWDGKCENHNVPWNILLVVVAIFFICCFNNSNLITDFLL